jgi:hypothetical protein
MTRRCRLCASNDADAVIEHVAAYMWESRMERVEERTPWEQAGATWQTAFREIAVAARQALTVPERSDLITHRDGPKSFLENPIADR